MDWDDLRSFQAIARHGSLTAAARALGVRQSTMGRRLAALEERLGHKLLHRTPEGFLPTPAGESILGHVEQIEQTTRAIDRTLTGQDARIEGPIRLSAAGTLTVEVLIPLLTQFGELHPKILLEMLVNNQDHSLERREVDMAIRLSRPTGADLVARKVGEIGFAFYCAPSYLERHGAPDFASGAAGHRIILSLHEPAALADDQKHLTFLAAEATVAFRSINRLAQFAACRAGMGIASIGRHMVAGTDLIRLAAPSPPPREIWLVVHADMRHMPRIRALSDFLADGLRGVLGRLG